MRKAVVLLLVAVLLLPWGGVLPALAQGETPPGPDDAEQAPTGIRGVLQRITHVMEFPIESMTKALRLSVEHILAGTLEGLGTLYSDAMRAVAFGEYASGPSIDVVQPMWSRVMQVSAVLWPLTLALVVLTAARGGVAASAVGYADLKESLLEWLGACVSAAISLYVMRWALSLSNAVADLFLPGNPVEIAKALGSALADTVLITYVSQFAPGGLIFMLVFTLSLGFAMLTAFLFSFIARYVILFALMSLAPLTLTLGTIPATRWLSWLWLKGLVLVFLLRPINNLLLNLAVKAAASGAFIVRMFVVAGIFSILLAINYAVAQAVFGAVSEIAKKAKATADQVVATVLLAAGGVAAGAAAVGSVAGAAGAAGAVGTAGAGGGGAAGATAAGGAGTATGATAKASSVASSGMATPRSTGSISSRVQAALNNPTALRRLGNVASTVGRGFQSTSRGPVGRAMGAAVSGAGNMMAEVGREREMEQEGALQTRYGPQTRALVGWGLNPKGDGFYDVANAQQRLEATYGRKEAREAAEPTARMMAAMQARGYSLTDMAQQAGFPSAGAWYGHRVETSLQTRLGVGGTSLFAPGGKTGFPESWSPGQLTAYDFGIGMRIAQGLGRAGHENDIGVYADLVHAFRAKGQEPVNELMGAALEVRQAHMGEHFGKWRPFAEKVEALAQKHNVSLNERVANELKYLKSVEPPLFG